MERLFRVRLKVACRSNMLVSTESGGSARVGSRNASDRHHYPPCHTERGGYAFCASGVRMGSHKVGHHGRIRPPKCLEGEPPDIASYACQDVHV